MLKMQYSIWGIHLFPSTFLPGCSNLVRERYTDTSKQETNRGTRERKWMGVEIPNLPSGEREAIMQSTEAMLTLTPAGGFSKRQPVAQAAEGALPGY